MYHRRIACVSLKTLAYRAPAAEGLVVDGKLPVKVASLARATATRLLGASCGVLLAVGDFCKEGVGLKCRLDRRNAVLVRVVLLHGHAVVHFRSLYIVEVATAADECIPCEANPFNLICRCKICRKTGMCKHVLLTTHIIMASRGPEERKAICNLKYMCSKTGGAKKGKGRAKAISLALEREPANIDDNNAPLQITW